MSSYKARPLELGSHRQLLFDRLFLEGESGVRLVVETPLQDPTPVLTADEPWEDAGIGSFNTVAFENGSFRMWYDAMAHEGDGQLRRALCHAESDDGVRWVKRLSRDTQIRAVTGHPGSRTPGGIGVGCTEVVAPSFGGAWHRVRG